MTNSGYNEADMTEDMDKMPKGDSGMEWDMGHRRVSWCGRGPEDRGGG